MLPPDLEGTAVRCSARTDGPAYAAMSHALEQAYGRPTTEGQGGSDRIKRSLRARWGRGGSPAKARRAAAAG